MRYQRLMVLMIAICLLMLSGLTTGAQSGTQVWTWYFSLLHGGNFNAAWAAEGDQPLRGIYDSRQGGVVGSQMAEAQSAGVDAFIMSWFGEGEPQTTAIVNNAFNESPGGFSVAVSIDSFQAPFNRDFNTLSASLNRVMTDYVNRPNYLRYYGKPVVFFTFQNLAGLSAAQWQQLRNQHDPARTAWWIAEGVDGNALYGGAMDGMWTFNLSYAANSAGMNRQKSAAENNGGFWIPTIHPGWNETAIAAATGRGNPSATQPRSNGQFLANSYRAAEAVGAGALIIVSWNEYYEGSYIEPSAIYGTQSLDTLRSLTSGASPAVPVAPVDPAFPVAPIPADPGVPVQLPEPPPVPIVPDVPADPAAPLAPQVSLVEGVGVEILVPVLNVRTGPGINNTRIGRANGNSIFPFLGEQNGWYAIDFNGVRGWVSGDYAQLIQIQTLNPVPAQPAPAGAIQLEATDRLNVRTGPGLDNRRIGLIAPGYRYTVTGQEGNWYAITYNGRTGWVSGDYVLIFDGS